MPSVLWNHEYPGIQISYYEHPAFFHQAGRDLDKLLSKPIGKSLIELISKRCQGIGTKLCHGLRGASLTRVCISRAIATKDGRSAVQNTLTVPMNGSKAQRIQTNFANKSKMECHFQRSGDGTGCDVRYNPSAEAQYQAAHGNNIEMPSFIVLGHELIHAYHALSGDMNSDENGKHDRLREEARTCGLGVYARGRISENRLREEHNLQPRTFYSVDKDCDKFGAGYQRVEV